MTFMGSGIGAEFRRSKTFSGSQGIKGIPGKGNRRDKDYD